MKYNLPVEGMTCASCVARVEKSLNKIDGIENVTVNYANEKVSFEVDENIDLDVAKQAVENDVHILGVSSLAAGHKTLVPQ